MKTEVAYDLSGKVIGLAMRIHSTLGAGFLESIYRRALAHELQKAGLKFKTEKSLSVMYDGILVGEFAADFLVENELIIELKAVQSLTSAHEVQTVNYLVATGIDIGLLVNFGGERLDFKKKFRLGKKSKARGFDRMSECSGLNPEKEQIILEPTNREKLF